MSQRMEALAKGNALRMERTAERASLRGAPPQELIPALVNPSEALASYRLRDLFVGKRGVVMRYSTEKFERTLRSLLADRPRGRRWHGEERLSELSEDERRRFCAALLAHAPKPWSGG